ncbi:gephyrin-like molybdotransferase Glp [Silicimonas sp. MF1-12-2]|uniref:molybdopterin molybdotransferase MoeA n=1 Tax=Silicimonas sp. MF1-12-2 TaxID=3384793 RepID=UPI0039B5B52F
MISVDEALGHIFDLVVPTGVETVPLRSAAGRILAAPVAAARNQPPFAVSVMDGFAIATTDANPGDGFHVIGEAAAGHAYKGAVGPGEAVRIFTGAPVPDGAARVIIQEDATREGDWIVLGEKIDSKLYIREIGADFKIGQTLDPPLVLSPAHVSLIASMNVPEVTVARRPRVALIATGDELVMPGETPGPDQIIASNSFGIAAALEQDGAETRLLPIARDNAASLEACFALATGTDLIVTIGGASVGDHDLVGQVAADLGMERAFYKIAMRPGKPLMAGRLNGTPMIGLPGNPVSSMVCAHIFVRPMVRAMQGLPKVALPMRSAPLVAPIGPNGPRQHYMRATLSDDGITVADRQDSALLSVLASANVLAVRPPHDGSREAGDEIAFIEY